MRTNMIVIVVSFALVFQAPLIESSKILMIPLGNKSHLFEIDGIGRELLNRQHQVYLLMSKVDTPPTYIAQRGYRMLWYNYVNQSTSPPLPGRDLKTVVESGESHVIRFMLKHWEEGGYFTNTIETIGINVLRDAQLFKNLHAIGFDLVVAQYCGVFITWPLLVAKKLGVPYVAQTSELTTWALRLPVLPGSDTNLFSAWMRVRVNDLPTSMWQRALNAMAIVLQDFVCVRVFGYDSFKQFVDFDDIRDVQGAAELTLVDHDHLLNDPIATFPHVVMVGGLATQPAKSISDTRLSRFLDEYERDAPIVVCSFGSLLDGLPSSVIDRLLAAFESVRPIRVVMRVNKRAIRSGIPSNVYVAEWLPQNDLLGHALTRAFVTHSGNNGQYEALYHGVPMIAFYAFADQPFNADRVARRGYGLKMDALSQFSSEDLARVVKDVVYNDTYRNAIGKASRIFHSDKHPTVRAADAIDRVLQFGGQHLRPRLSFQYKSAVQLYGVDVLLLFVLLCGAATFAFCYACYSLLKWRLRRVKHKLD